MTDTHATTLPSAAEMHAAVSRRDARFDGVFFYGVVTTGVFCLPSCAARPARPENIRFFASAELAREAGLRPCKRCRPQHAADERVRLLALARYLQANASEQLTLAALAERAGISRDRLQRRFQALFGVSPRAYQEHARLDGFKQALAAGNSVTGAIHAAGFGSSSRVYEPASRNLGMTPRSYRAGGAGETISYAARHTILGWLLLAATDRGLCFAQFGDSRTALEQQLRREFPRATLTPSQAAGSAQLDAWMSGLVAHLEQHTPRPDVPLDLRGTAFQVQVWRYLLQVPAGQLISYAELAAGAGRPAAVRAAASACSANRIAVLVPCHRVLRGDGSLGGYRWGIERKRALIDAERGRTT